MLRIIPAAIAAIFMSNAHAWVWVDNQNTETLCDDNAYPLKPKNIDNIAPLKNNEAIVTHWQAQKNACIVPTETPTPTPTPTPSPTPVPTPTPTPTPTPDLLEGKTKCGDEWGWCRFPDYGVYDVWFGDANELSAPKTVEGFGVQCNESNFSDKDIKGSSCYIKQGVAPSPTPVPTPTPTPTPVPTPVPTPTPTDPHQGHMMPKVDTSKNMTPAIGYSTLRRQPVPDPNNPTFKPSPNSVTGGDFRIHCDPAKMGNFDFIVYPGQDGKAHHHTFFGNTGVTAFSTPDTVKNSGNSTCQGGIANRSSYWLPSLIDTNTNAPIEPDWALFYYKGGEVKPPNGLMMIAGDQTATNANPQDKSKIRWECNEKYESGQPFIPDCSGEITAIVHFPNWWDGKNLDSPDHKSHMSYTRTATHTKELPNISGIIHYRVNGTQHLRIASDNYMGGRGGYSLHMDYVFGWNDDVLDTWWQNCNIPNRDCHADVLGDGTWLY